MTIVLAQSTRSTYTDLTASMQTDPEARRHPGDAASVSSLRAFPIDAARCATYPITMEWVSDRERRVVPDLMAALCRRCPGRQACLLWALAGNEQGYWAGTTSTDRGLLRQMGQDSVEAADWVQDLGRRDLLDGALHPQGDGSYWWYKRRGCRCGECKAANAGTRASERAKARRRTA